jgi:hypothetical protein
MLQFLYDVAAWLVNQFVTIIDIVNTTVLIPAFTSLVGAFNSVGLALLGPINALFGTSVQTYNELFDLTWIGTILGYVKTIDYFMPVQYAILTITTTFLTVATIRVVRWGIHLFPTVG